MVLTIKVSKEKAEKERAREAGDRKLAMMKKLREENKKRVQRIIDCKEKQLKIIRDEKEKQKKNPKRDESSKGNPKVSEGVDLLIWRVPFQRLVREIMQRRREGLKLQSSAFWHYRKWGRHFSRAPQTSKYMCHPCKMSDHNAEGHTVSTENQRRFLNRKVEWKL